ncbi:MAG: DUF2933 domain-containing protein, partial [Chloroflexota bacterium]
MVVSAISDSLIRSLQFKPRSVPCYFTLARLALGALFSASAGTPFGAVRNAGRRVIRRLEEWQNAFDVVHAKENRSMNKRSIPWVLVGCLALAAGVAAVFVLGIPTNTVLLVALVLACPLAHLWMMRTGMHNHGP